jgi:hypothetical protein
LERKMRLDSNTTDVPSFSRWRTAARAGLPPPPPMFSIDMKVSMPAALEAVVGDAGREVEAAAR